MASRCSRVAACCAVFHVHFSIAMSRYPPSTPESGAKLQAPDPATSSVARSEWDRRQQVMRAQITERIITDPVMRAELTSHGALKMEQGEGSHPALVDATKTPQAASDAIPQHDVHVNVGNPQDKQEKVAPFIGFEALSNNADANALSSSIAAEGQKQKLVEKERQEEQAQMSLDTTKAKLAKTIKNNDHIASFHSMTGGQENLYEWDYYERTTAATGCGHNLSGVDDDALNATLNKEHSLSPFSISPQLATLQTRSYFIAACLHASEEVLPHWTAELLRVIMALRMRDASGKPRADNIFVSIYESGSDDRTHQYLDSLKAYLTFLGVAHVVTYGNLVKKNMNRIEFLGKVRNFALEPLVNSTKIFDQVLWLNDVFFCADGVLQMAHYALPQRAGGLGADAVCGMDYYKLNARKPPLEASQKETCLFYDAWAARDVTGTPFAHTFPYMGDGEEEYESNQPFQVFSCWNGMAMFAADIFQVQQLLFRRNRINLGECAAGEAELLMRDMWKVGRGKIIVSPKSATCYNTHVFKECVAPKQPVAFDKADLIEYSAAPSEVACCPLREHAMAVNWTDCHQETWDRFGFDVPRLATLKMHRAFQSDGDSTVILIGDQTGDVLLNRYQGFVLLGTVAFFLGMLSEQFRRLQESQPVIVPLIFWGFSSMAMNVMNKLAVTILPLPLTLVAIQLVIADVLLVALLGLQTLRELQDKADIVLRRAVLTLPFIGVLATSMMALDECSVTTLLMVRNALPLVSIFIEETVLPQSSERVTFRAFLALLTTALGTVLYAAASHFSNEQETSLGSKTILCIVLNMLLTVGHRLCERCLLVDPSMTFSFGSVAVLNNTMGLLLVAPLVLLRGEHNQWSEYSQLLNFSMASDHTAVLCIALSGCTGVSMGYYGIVLQKQVTATSMLVLQTVIKILTIVMALFIFRDHLTLVTGLGCVVSLAGSAWYGSISCSSGEEKKKQCENENIEKLAAPWGDTFEQHEAKCATEVSN